MPHNHHNKCGGNPANDERDRSSCNNINNYNKRVNDKQYTERRIQDNHDHK